MLKVFNDRFKSIVTTGRPEAKKTDKGDPLSGLTVFAMDAIDMNLIDEIGNMNVAVRYCTELSTNYSQTNNTMKIPFKSTWLAIGAIFSKKEGDDVTEADVEQMNTELTARQTSIDNLSSQVSAKETENATLTQQLADATKGNETLQSALTQTEESLTAANAELAKRPGTVATAPVVEVEKIEISQEVALDEINQEASKYR